MTQAILPTSINLITGPLGSGKTTLLRHLITLKPKHENWVLLVNEFGSVGVDGAILENDSTVQSVQLPGGCICCTAKNELEASISDILSMHKPERILIEPTGLGEPDSLADILQAASFKNQIQLNTIFAVLDCASVTLQAIQDFSIMQNLLNMADVVLLNKPDLATPHQVQTLQNYCDSLFPAKKAVLTCQHAKISDQWLDLEHLKTAKSLANTSLKTQPNPHKSSTHNLSPTTTHQGVMLPYLPINLQVPVERLYKNELGVQSIGYIFDDVVTFDWKKLYNLFQSLNLNTDLQGVVRAKGVLKVGNPWMLFQWVNQQATREYISYRRDSRLELLIETNAPFNFSEFETQLKACIL